MQFNYYGRNLERTVNRAISLINVADTVSHNSIHSMCVMSVNLGFHFESSIGIASTLEWLGYEQKPGQAVIAMVHLAQDLPRLCSS